MTLNVNGTFVNTTVKLKHVYSYKGTRPMDG